MAKQYGWIAKDKDGDFWYGTLGKFQKDVESQFGNSWRRYKHDIKIVQVKITEVK